MYLISSNGLKLWQKAVVIIFITLFSMAFLLFLAIWVIFPIVFMSSISVETFFIFLNVNSLPTPDFANPSKYEMDGTVNFYIDIENEEDDTSISIGSWLILPADEKNILVNPTRSAETAVKLLANTSYPVILYMHGVFVNRAKNIFAYKALRKQFLVIAVDHRGFGDSSDIRPTELGIVNDTIQIYQWIRNATKNDIYIWGHSLGTALGTHVVRKLKEQYDIVPTGLFLESAITSLREEIPRNPIGKLFAWLAYFEETIQSPLETNGFLFRQSSDILYLSEVAKTQRNISLQGNVTYIQFESKLGYNHIHIITDPYINDYIGYTGTSGIPLTAPTVTDDFIILLKGLYGRMQATKSTEYLIQEKKLQKKQ